MAIINVVSWESTPDIFAYKYPERNLTTFTQLVVHQSQEAALFHKGKLVSKFGPGKHTLSTENFPVLHELFGLPFGGENPFTAEVWFVNKAFALDVKWGTTTPFNVRDPLYEVMVPVRANGQFGVQIEDMEQFLVKLVGMLPVFDKENLSLYLKGLLMAEATGIIAGKILQDKISVLDIAAHIIPISKQLKDSIGEQLKEYGVCLLNFYVNSISVSEDDQAVKHLKALLSKRAEMSVLGYTYQQERSFDVLDSAANNQGQMGGVMGAGMGLGMGFGMGGAMGDMTRSMAPNLQQGGGMNGAMGSGINAATGNGTNNAIACGKCNTLIDPQARFCPSCGTAPTIKLETTEKKATTVVCDKCAKEIPENAKFCPHCGDIYNKCPECNADMEQGATKCNKCGHLMPIECPECRSSVQANVNFCPECGKSMKKTCGKCGHSVPTSSNAFCANCGNTLG